MPKYVSGFSASNPRIAPLGQIYFKGQQFGAICPRSGFLHLTSYCEQWILERTGQKSGFQDMLAKDDPKPNAVNRVSG
ncbi:hypothetical protein E4U41_002664 [Claviceps citrina]|nr:hypothetical protein E4U41_002664 [Claviceps citrina]